VLMKTGRLWFRLLLLFLLIAGLSACISPAISTPVTSSSPLAVPTTAEALSILPTVSPLPEVTEAVNVGQATSVPSPVLSSSGDSSSAPIRFSLDLPLEPGATRVTGHGPAGLRIAIVDVSLGTDEIGTGEIGVDGAFAVDVKPLPAGDRIGIMAGTSLPPEFEANLDLLWGEGGIQLPMFGNVFASATVKRP
jgi:hypothetical protein